MKILTINVHAWVEVNALSKLYTLADTIINENYDIVALQEVNQLIVTDEIPIEYNFPSKTAIKIKTDNFAFVLQETLQKKGSHYDWAWSDCHIGYKIYEEGVAILSKYPIKEIDEILLRDGLDFEDVRRRKALGVATELSGELIWFYTGHFSWWTREGENLFIEEWNIINAHLKEKRKKYPVFLMGDFNNDASIKEEGYELITKKDGWYDVYSLAKKTGGNHTVSKEIDGWEGNYSKLRIDYIFASELYSVESCRVVFDSNHYEIISDHFGVDAMINLNK